MAFLMVSPSHICTGRRTGELNDAASCIILPHINFYEKIIFNLPNSLVFIIWYFSWSTKPRYPLYRPPGCTGVTCSKLDWRRTLAFCQQNCCWTWGLEMETEMEIECTARIIILYNIQQDLNTLQSTNKTRLHCNVKPGPEYFTINT